MTSVIEMFCVSPFHHHWFCHKNHPESTAGAPPPCQAPDGAPSWPPALKWPFKHVPELSVVVSTTTGRCTLYPHALAQLLTCRRQISRASSRLAGGHRSVVSLPSSRIPPLQPGCGAFSPGPQQPLTALLPPGPPLTECAKGCQQFLRIQF